VHRALDKKPENRFPTVGEFVAAMEHGSTLSASSPAISLAGTGAGDATLVVPTQGTASSDLATTPMPSLQRSMPGVAPSDAAMGTLATPKTIPPRPGPLRPTPKKRGAPIGLIAAAVIVVGGGAAGAWYVMSRNAAPTTSTQVTAEPAPSAPQTTPPRDTVVPPAQQQVPAPQQAAAATPTPPTETPAAPRTGTLVIQGMPPGGTVTVDGRIQRGSQIELAPGRHAIELIHPSYETQSATVTIAAGRAEPLRFRAARLAEQQQAPVTPPTQTQPVTPAPARAGLLEGQGILRLGVNVAAEIYIQGRLVGRNRVTDTLLAGTIEIRIVAPEGYRDTTIYHTVNPGPESANPPLRVVLNRR
jgi:hypothetical protein